jgi:histidine phosphotransferase ChpT
MSDVHPGSEGMETGGDLAALVASRICHDVAGPLGAVANGLELLVLAGLPPSPELDLLGESVEGAVARLRFFRLAFGAPRGRAVGRAEVEGILRGIEKTSRLTYAWTASGDLPREEVKAAFLLLLCLESSLPLGGSIAAAREDGQWRLEGEGRRLRPNGDLWAALAAFAPLAPETAAEVPFAVLSGTLAALGRRLEVEITDGRIVARF